jgi:hypothetical protein
VGNSLDDIDNILHDFNYSHPANSSVTSVTTFSTSVASTVAFTDAFTSILPTGGNSLHYSHFSPGMPHGAESVCHNHFIHDFYNDASLSVLSKLPSNRDSDNYYDDNSSRSSMPIRGNKYDHDDRLFGPYTLPSTRDRYCNFIHDFYDYEGYTDAFLPSGIHLLHEHHK